MNRDNFMFQQSFKDSIMPPPFIGHYPQESQLPFKSHEPVDSQPVEKVSTTFLHPSVNQKGWYSGISKNLRMLPPMKS